MFFSLSLSLIIYRFDSPLQRHVKSAVVGFSINSKMPSHRNSPNTVGGGATNANTPAMVKPALLQPAPPNPTTRYTVDNRRTRSAGETACFCYGKPTICNVCIIKKEVRASRAGTPGYRPPEVLLKHPGQTTAVDMWAIGVIMISIMSACYPFFKGNDDFTALAEMITIFGDEAIRKTALYVSRHVCASQKKRPLHLRKLCNRLRNRSALSTINTTNRTTAAAAAAASGGGQVRHQTCENCQQILPECLCSSSPLNMDFSADIFPESAYDLMAKLLTINPDQRISAEEALKHPFLWADL